MTVCAICGEDLPPDRKVCEVCGTSVPSGTAPSANQSGTEPKPVPPPATPTVGPRLAPRANRVCLLCNASYGSDYDDEFCRCGGELVEASDQSLGARSESSGSPILGPPDRVPQPSGNQKPQADVRASQMEPARPPAGTDCLVVYSDQKTPIHYCAIDKDVTLIGRKDVVRGDFPDLDLGEFFDQATSRKISRKHAIVLRLRDSHSYLLRPLGGNTGTQIEHEMAEPLRDYPLAVGTRVILGGAVRLKFEKIM